MDLVVETKRKKSTGWRPAADIRRQDMTGSNSHRLDDFFLQPIDLLETKQNSGQNVGAPSLLFTLSDKLWRISWSFREAMR